MQTTLEKKAYQKAYYQSKAGKAAHVKYDQSEKGKARAGRSNAKYYATINGHLRIMFSGMKRRCTNPNHPKYSRYGGRGIKVCFESANDFVSYVIDVLQVDPRGLTIDRIDNDGNYEPGNIRFVTHAINQQNKR